MTHLPIWNTELVTRLPSILMDIELSMTNLTTLPSNLHVACWPQMELLYLEHSPFTDIFKMKIDELSLIGNQIKEIPGVNSTEFSMAFISFCAIC